MASGSPVEAGPGDYSPLTFTISPIRPHDPTLAPGVLFSPRTRPPNNIGAVVVSEQTLETWRASASESVSIASPSPDPSPTPSLPPPSPPVKKSWASLLKPAQPKSQTATPSTRNSSSPVPSLNKAEILSLLSTPGAITLKPITPRGLINTGNMCFANSVLQVLVYCLPFSGLFNEELGRALGEENAYPVVGSSAPVKKPKSKAPLVQATVEFLGAFKPKGKGKERDLGVRTNEKNGKNGKSQKRSEEEEEWDLEAFIPSNVYDAMKEKKQFDIMRSGHQEDAEEFFGFYLDTLEEELLTLMAAALDSQNPDPNSLPKTVVQEEEEPAEAEGDGWVEIGRGNRMVVTRTIKSVESPITRIFGGKFRSTLRVAHQKDSVVIDDWRTLRLDIQHPAINTIPDALSHLSHPQPVNLPTTIGSQQVLIESLPPILVLHLKRFCYDMDVGGVVKVGKYVRFEPELVFRPDVMAKKGHGGRYKIFGVVYHHGLSAGGGHYTLDVLHPTRYPDEAKTREGWVRIDDELVSDVRPEDVFGNGSRGDDSRCAYLLFYKRI